MLAVGVALLVTTIKGKGRVTRNDNQRQTQTRNSEQIAGARHPHPHAVRLFVAAHNDGRKNEDREGRNTAPRARLFLVTRRVRVNRINLPEKAPASTEDGLNLLSLPVC